MSDEDDVVRTLCTADGCTWPAQMGYEMCGSHRLKDMTRSIRVDEPAQPVATPPQATTSSPLAQQIHERALEWLEVGGCVVPPASDGTKTAKRPKPNKYDNRWEHFLQRRATREEVDSWWVEQQREGIGVVCGPISGREEGLGLTALDVEHLAVSEGWWKTVLETGAGTEMGEILDRVIAGYSETTGGGGIRSFWWCPCDSHEPPSDTPRREGAAHVMAGRPRTEEESSQWFAEQQAMGKTVRAGTRPPFHVLIELRVAGHYAVVSPSNGRTHESGRPWVLDQGGPSSIVTLTEEECLTLRVLLSSVDQREILGISEESYGPSQEATSERPGDIWKANAENTWESILEPIGWEQQFTRGDLTYWCRPGKKRGISATTGLRPNGKDLLVVFTTSTVLDTRAYDKWGAYVRLHHDGDFSAAAEAAIRVNPEKGTYDDLVAEMRATSGQRERHAAQAQESMKDPATWPDPIRLTNNSYIPADMTLLPAALRNMATEVARATDTHPDLALLGGLAAVSAVTFGAARAEMYFGEYEPLSLWAWGGASSGDRKTRVLKYMIVNPMEAVIKAASSVAAKDVKGLATELAVAKFELKALSRRTSTTADEFKKALERERAAELAMREIPSPFFSDSTSESLLEVARLNRGPFLVATDESKFLKVIGGQYARGGEGDTAFLNASYDGSAYNRSRVTSGMYMLPEVISSLCLFVQPDTLSGYANTSTDESGFLPRFLFALPPSSVGFRSLDGKTIPAAVNEAWNKVLQRIGFDFFSIYWDRTKNAEDYGPWVGLPLSDEARALVHAYAREVEHKMRPGGVFAPIEAWANKQPSRLTRVAAAIALIRHAEGGGAFLRPVSSAGAKAGVSVTITGDDMRAALSLAPWMENSTLLAMNALRDGTEAEAAVARWAVDRARSQPDQEYFTTREAHRGHGLRKKPWNRTMADMEELLHDLEDRGWLRCVPAARKSKHWYLNPRATADLV
jgi:hypothetical protein